MLEHGILNLPIGSKARGGNINRQLDKYKAEAANKKAAEHKNCRAEFAFNKANAKRIFEANKAEIKSWAVEKCGKKDAKAAIEAIDGWIKWEPTKALGLFAEKGWTD
jgi:hypothetical protein